MDEFVVSFNPVPAAERVARWHGRLRTQLIMLVVLAVLGFGAMAILGPDTIPLTSVIIIVSLTLVAAVVDIVMINVAKRDLTALGEGAALVVDRFGIQVRDVRLGWAEVAGWSTKNSPWRSPQLVVRRLDGTSLALPLDYLDHRVADIDGAVRAFSGGRQGVDLSGLGA